MDSDSNPPAWLTIGLAGACILALFDWPYGYYQLLRLSVTLYSAWIAWSAFKSSQVGWGWAFGFLALLYNPFIKISLEKDLWQAVNVFTAIAFLTVYWRFRSPSAKQELEKSTDRRG
ncbi:DUF6804 family protein [Erythrobacter aurantius]|uniref:DUF6804 family protein n=1 Tax=Erythrobacter aurantius TaxID=2909249 RepID=UPI0038B28AFA